MPPRTAAPAKKAWEALTNLSIGRVSKDSRGERMADVVHKGEIVHLTDEEAHGFLRRHRVPVIRPASEQNTPAPRVLARDLFGARPPASAFGAREDPPGSSRVIEHPEAEPAVADPADPRNHPEATDPQTDLLIDPDAAKDR
jgi:hypothetical protein